MKANTYKYLFRICPGKTPFHVGTYAKDLKDYKGRLQNEMYVAPCMYSWIRHWFNNEDDRLFAIRRPNNLNPMMMCCGINSLYHFCHLRAPKDVISELEDCIRFKKPLTERLQKISQIRDEKSKQKWGSDYKNRLKGYNYLATLQEWDSKHPKDSYPQLMIDPKSLRSCQWEELEYVKRDIFIGKDSHLIYQIEQKLPKYGLRFKS